MKLYPMKLDFIAKTDDAADILFYVQNGKGKLLFLKQRKHVVKL